MLKFMGEFQAYKIRFPGDWRSNFTFTVEPFPGEHSREIELTLEFHLRAGTENTAMILGLGAAARLVNLNLGTSRLSYFRIRIYLLAYLFVYLHIYKYVYLHTYSD